MSTIRRIWKAVAAAAAMAALGAASGCTTAMVETTPFRPSGHAGGGAAEKRGMDVKLWPLAYWHRPAGSVLWPLVTFTDEHFGVFPLYSQNRLNGPSGPWDEFNVLWPLVTADARSGNGWALPLLFWGKGWQVLFPLYWNGPDYNVMVPLWWKTRHSFTTPLVGWGDDGYWAVPWLGSWGDSPNPGDRYWVAALGLAAGGHRVRAGRLNRWFWVFPFATYDSWTSDTGAAASGGRPVWAHSEFSLLFGLLGDRKHVEWGGDSTETSVRALLGLGRWRWHDGVLVRSRFFPFWGRRRSAKFPERLAWLDAATLPDVARPIEPSHRAELLREMEQARTGHERVFISKDGKLTMGTRHVTVPEAPLYDWECSDIRRCLFTVVRRDVLKGRFTDGEGRPVEWDGDTEAARAEMEFSGEWGVPLLVNSRSGRKVVFDVVGGGKILDRSDTQFDALAYLGRWRWENGTNVQSRFFPLWSRTRDADFAERAAWLDAGVLPEEAATGGDWERNSSRRWLLLFGSHATVRGRGAGEGGEPRVLEASSEWGIPLLGGCRSERTVEFDAAGGAKTGEATRSSAHVLGLLYRHSAQTGVDGEEDFSRHSVLWRVWHWERRGEDVSWGVFPGVAREARGDGYRKVSWLWRLFRWENDPAKGTAVDVLFIPVWRGGTGEEGGSESGGDTP